VVTLVMIGIGVAAAAYRYPGGVDVEATLAHFDAAVARVAALLPPFAADGPARTGQDSSVAADTADGAPAVAAEAAGVASDAADAAVSRTDDMLGHTGSTEGETVDASTGDVPSGDVPAGDVDPAPADVAAADDRAPAVANATLAADKPPTVDKPQAVDKPQTDARAAGDDWRLTRARQLLARGAITYPPDANAVSMALDLLAEQPGHQGALDVLTEATNQLLTSAIQAYERGFDYQARNTLEEIFGFNPDNRRARQLWREWVGTAR
jgi:hypothetical protein